MFYITLGFIGIRLCVALANLWSWPLLRKKEPSDTPLVSVLIPARNEAGNMGGVLESLINQAYAYLEIIVLDDGSTDGTAEVVGKFAGRDKRIRLMEGSALPSGWLGKNWACHQLSQSALGDYFLFVDADVTLGPEAIGSALATVQKKNLALLSVFPTQIMDCLGEKVTVPIMHWLLLSMLPLQLIYRSKRPSLAAANGQFMLFNAKEYRVNTWHEQVKREVAEDIRIMQAVKRCGLRGATLLGNHQINCRMYQSLSEGIAGFSKNMKAGFGNSVFIMTLYLWLTLLSWPLFLFSVPLNLILLALGGIIMMRIFISLPARESLVQNVLLHPAQLLILAFIALSSAWKEFTKTNTWKGRNINI